ncbi:MAG: AAA family ATPase [Microscillaceae bacterium]|nr:AAA family ATPase [Microscillaceae bacterium]
MQLTQIGLKNFRVFEDTQLDIRPITIITGANSSGKSSVFKALMLLEENAKKHNLAKLTFESGGHILGSFESVRNRYHNENDKIGFTFKGNFMGLTTSISYTYTQDKNNGILSSSVILANTKEAFIQISQKDSHYVLEFNGNCIAESNFDFGNLIKELFNDQLEKIVTIEKLYQAQEKILFDEIEQNAESNLTEQREKLEQSLKQKIIELENTYNQLINQTSDEDEKDRLNKELYEKKEGEERQTWFVDFEEIKQKYIEQVKKEKSQRLKDGIGEQYRQDVIYQVQKNIIIEQLKKSKIEEQSIDLRKWVQNFKDSFLISESIGENPLNTYSAEFSLEAEDYVVDNLLRLDIRRAIYEYIIIKYINLLTKFITFTHLPAVRGKQERIITFSNQNDVLESTILNLLQKNYNSESQELEKIQKFIRKWLSNSIDKEKRKFEIGYDIKIEPIDGGSVILKILQEEADTEGRNLADFGLGISQLLPIILTCVTAQPNTLICIEEPETNLHPKFQSMLAEMFVDAHKTFGVQFALETHSEYLIMKLQELVLETSGYSKLEHNKVIIYYFKKGEVLHTYMDEFGNIDESIFGEGFFDVVPNLRGSLLQKQIKKSINPIFVEGKTDKLILEKAIQIFAEKDLKDVSVHTDTTNTGSGINGVKDILMSWIHDRESQNSKALVIIDHDTPAIDMKSDLECNINNKPKYPKYIDFIQQKRIKIFLLSKPAWLIDLYQKGVFENNYHFNYSLEHLFPDYWQYAESKRWLIDREDKVRLKNPSNVSEIDYLKNQGLDESFLRLFFKKVDNFKKVKFAKYICSQMDNSDKWNDLKNLVKQIEDFFYN